MLSQLFEDLIIAWQYNSVKGFDMNTDISLDNVDDNPFDKEFSMENKIINNKKLKKLKNVLKAIINLKILAKISKKNPNHKSLWAKNPYHIIPNRYSHRIETEIFVYNALNNLNNWCEESKFGPQRYYILKIYGNIMSFISNLLMVIEAMERKVKNLENMENNEKYNIIFYHMNNQPQFRFYIRKIVKLISEIMKIFTFWMKKKTLNT